MSALKRLVHEIHRRSLWQVLGLYVVGSWIALQVVETLSETVGLPEWFGPAAFGLLIVGLPIVVATAFVQEGAGGVESRPEPSAGDETAPKPAPATGSTPGPDAPSGMTDGSPQASASPSSESGGTRDRLFTWRNAILGGVAAFALLGLVTAGWMAMRSLGIGPAGTLVAKGVLEEREPILLADFQSPTGDSLLAQAATEAFRADLAGSSVVTLLEPRQVAEALRRMERPTGGGLDPETAGELALREGIKAFAAGEIAGAGEGYVLTARLVSASDGAILVSERETAADASEVIPAIDALSRKLRERVGESLREVRAEAPLARATTGSLEALRKYSQAVRAAEVEGDAERAIALLEEALTLDPEFAMAWRKLGVILSNTNQQRARMVEALTKAYEYRDRLTEREKYHAVGIYHIDVTGDREKAITAYENLLEIDPTHAGALNNLAILYQDLDDYERAGELFERAAALDTTSGLFAQNVAFNRVFRGEIQGARAALEVWERRAPATPLLHFARAGLASIEGDYAEAETHARTAAEEHRESLAPQQLSSAVLAALAAIQGKLAEAEDHSRSAAALAVRRNLPEDYLQRVLDIAFRELLVAGDTAQAERLLEEALELYPLESLDPLDRPYEGVARLLALVGRVDRARELAAEMQTEIVPVLGRDAELDLHEVRGDIALAEGRYEEAIREHLRAEEGTCRRRCSALTRAYDLAGRRDSAVALYERYMATTAPGGFFSEQYNLAPFAERLGQLYDEAGDLESSAKWYAKFVELWADADPELQPRVQAAQARLEEIVAERG